MTTKPTPDPLGATMVTEARCPACATPLTQLTTSTTVIAGCPRCGGIWLDAQSCEAVARGELDEEKKKFAKNIGVESPPVERTVFRDAATPPPERHACPVCATDLTPTYLHDANLTVMTCAAHGTFFAQNQLLRVADAAAVQKVTTVEQMPRVAPKRPASVGARALFMLGGALFVASMAMPSMRIHFFGSSDAPGILCAVFGFVAIEKMPNASLAACGNVWLVTCPIYAWSLRAQGSAISSAVAVFVGVMAASIWAVEAGKDLLAGYYVWVASYFVIALGFLVRAIHERALSRTTERASL